MKKLISLLLCAAMLSAMLAGCGSAAAKTGTAGTTGEAASGKSGAEAGAQKPDISVCAGSEDSMVVNTGTVGTLEGLSACRHLYEGLYKIDATGKPVLGQAKDVKVSEDGLTYTFTLRDDITWSDGQPVKAGDFLYGWQYLKTCANDYSDLLSMVSI